jgi:tRNA U34 5-carboxymethylaminomethyl modifying GTPase MnmE/TrmE
MKENIDAWKKAGGIGILHTSGPSTIKQLKKLLKDTEKEASFRGISSIDELLSLPEGE